MSRIEELALPKPSFFQRRSFAFNHSTVATIAAFAAVYLGWGTTYLAIRVGVESMPPGAFLALRFLSASLIIAPLAILTSGHRASREQLWGSAKQGALLLVGGLLPVAYAEKNIPSNVTAITIGLAPIAFALFDRWINGTPVHRYVVYGFVAGFAGVGALNLPTGDHAAATDLGSMLLLLAGCATWCFASVVARQTPAVPSALGNVMVQYVVSGALLLAFSVVAEGFSVTVLRSASRDAWISLVYLALVPSILSYTAYVWLLQNQPSSRVATYAFVNPIVAVIAGALLLGEKADFKVLAALLLIITGTGLSFLAKTKGKSE